MFLSAFTVDNWNESLLFPLKIEGRPETSTVAWSALPTSLKWKDCMAEYNGALSPKAGLRGRRPSTYTSTQMWLCSAVRDGLGFALSKVDAAGVTPRWGSSRHLTGSVYAAYKATQMAANAIPTPELKVVRKKKKKADESCAAVTQKQRLEKLLRERIPGVDTRLGSLSGVHAARSCDIRVKLTRGAGFRGLLQFWGRLSCHANCEKLLQVHSASGSAT